MSITLDSGKLPFGYKVLLQFLILSLFFFFLFLSSETGSCYAALVDQVLF